MSARGFPGQVQKGCVSGHAGEKCLGRSQGVSRPPGALDHMPQGDSSDWLREKSRGFKDTSERPSLFGIPQEQGKHSKAGSCTDHGRRGLRQLDPPELPRPRQTMSKDPVGPLGKLSEVGGWAGESMLAVWWTRRGCSYFEPPTSPCLTTFQDPIASLGMPHV